MNRAHGHAALIVPLALAGLGLRCPARAIDVDLSGYRADCGVTVRRYDDHLAVEWPARGEETCQLILDLRDGKPLFENIAVADKSDGAFRPVLQGVDPVAFVVMGERRAPAGRPPEMSVFNVFFDSPASRPFKTYRSHLDLKQTRVMSHGRRATVILAGLTIGPFAGEWQITVYPGAGLVQLEAVVSTNLERRAYLYDLGLASESAIADQLVWFDTEGKTRQTEPERTTEDRHLAVRHRLIVAETKGGTIACFPPPHQYFFPRDRTDNQQTVWYGRNHRGLDSRYGFGIRQTERGGGSYVPWFNAPPGTAQRLGVFFLIKPGDATEALKETLRFTHRRPLPPARRLSNIHQPFSHGHHNGRSRGKGPWLDSFHTRLRRDVQEHGSEHGPSGGIPRRWPSARSRPAAAGRAASHVRGVPPAFGRRLASHAR